MSAYSDAMSVNLHEKLKKKIVDKMVSDECLYMNENTISVFLKKLL